MECLAQGVCTRSNRMEAAHGVAVGALLVRKRKVQAVIEILDGQQWRKKRVSVAKVDDETRARSTSRTPKRSRPRLRS